MTLNRFVALVYTNLSPCALVLVTAVTCQSPLRGQAAQANTSRAADLMSPSPAESALSTPSALSTAEIDLTSRLRLAGNTRPEANPKNDLGPVADGLPLNHVQMLLLRSRAQQSALDAYVASLTERSSANYHNWLTPEQFGTRFGLTDVDLERVTGWLQGHGLTVNAVYPNRMMIDFSATAGQIRETFHTEIHAYETAQGGRTVRHIANASDPAIPAGLATVVAGIVSLHNFRPRSMAIPRPLYTMGTGLSTVHPVTPADLAVIYNLTPLFKAGYTGKGETIAVLSDSDVYSTADWTTFRSEFGLSSYSTGTLTELHPAPATGVNNCAAPAAIPGWDEEPILDAEFASASAPGAAIVIDACANTDATSGGLIALANVVNGATERPSVITISYGTCEAANGATANAAISSAYEQAAAEGISVFAAAGDAGAAFCDMGAFVAADGMGVNAYASTAYNVAVGGTDFADVYSRTTADYWSTSNSSTGDSAKSYIPEIPWNDSCANPLIALWNGYATTYGASGFCFADASGAAAYQTTVAGSGGASGCATGASLQPWVVDGGCKGWAKPAWQSVTGNPKDAHRDLPDLALFAADGIWGHFFLFCDSDTADQDGMPCEGTSIANWSQGGGTSFAAPIMAGIQALIDQKWGHQGNPNPVYYSLASTEYASATTRADCNSAKGAASTSTCIFHDVTEGASTVDCEGLIDCYSDVLSTSLDAYDPAFNATAGWDFATGLGSVNAYNLVMSTAW